MVVYRDGAPKSGRSRSISGTLGPRHRVPGLGSRRKTVNRRLRARTLLGARQPRRPFQHLLVLAVTLLTAGLVGVTQLESGQSESRLASIAPSFGAPSGPISSVDQAPLLASADVELTPVAEETQPAAEAAPIATSTPAPKKSRRAALARQEAGEPRRVTLGARITTTPTPSPTAPAAARLSTLYQVQDGDTAAAVAQSFGVSLATVLWNNPLVADPDMLFVGQQLEIPIADGILYSVKLGDTLDTIAAVYGVTPDAIVGFTPNGIAGSADLHDGQRILVPGGVSTLPPTPEPTETATPEPTDTPVPTETPGPTDTPVPTDTPTVEPTDTPTVEPTDTPTPEPTDTPTPEPTDTPTPLPTETPLPTDTPTPEPTDTPGPVIPAGAGYATDRLNLRSGPGTDFGVLLVIPLYGALTIDDAPTGGFYPVTYQGTSGWAAGDYLASGDPPSTPTPTPTPEPTETPRGGVSFSWPITGPISSYFGPSHPLGIDIDLYGRDGAPVGASAPGTVIWSGGEVCCSYGLYVIVDHGNGWTTTYGHFSKLAVSVGDYVDTGSVVGYAGTTGYSTGTHLHFEIRKDNVPLNPLDYLP